MVGALDAAGPTLLEDTSLSERDRARLTTMEVLMAAGRRPPARWWPGPGNDDVVRRGRDRSESGSGVL
ncbi:MAG: hypothetical protein JOZ82_04620 [Marmoricola sp.]|nr:hypothetical protein [Marmoricola sp.]